MSHGLLKNELNGDIPGIKNTLILWVYLLIKDLSRLSSLGNS
jgi:hypothetical protein